MPGDTVLVACGTYYEHDIVMRSGILLRSESGEPDCVTIDAGRLGRVLVCADVDADASVVGLTVTGGPADGPPDAAYGGGIYCDNASSPPRSAVRVVPGRHLNRVRRVRRVRGGR